MNDPLPQTPPSVRPEPRLRLWPAVVIVGLQWTISLVAARYFAGEPLHFYASFVGPMIAGGLFLLWWLLGSRIRWTDRFLVLVVVAVAGAALVLLEENRSVGGFKLVLYAIPAATAVWALWLLVTPMLRWPVRRTGVMLAVALAFGYCALVRLDGVRGNMSAELNWRWNPTAEDRYLAARAPATKTTASLPAEALALRPGDWPGFRGADRAGHLRGVRIATDWTKNPPKQLWRHPVGPGWSSFVVVGTRLYTQEQRGDDEVVVCYDADTGKEIWSQRDSARFVEAVGGNGPRATPTFHAGKLYTLGAKGKLNCLDAATGQVHWYREVTADTGAAVPQWAFASSPLVLDGLVSVFAGAPDGKAVQAYDAATGEPKWAAGEGTHSYSSPQAAQLAGVSQILIVTDQGLTALEPSEGKVLWNHEWALGIQRVVQPAVIGDSDVLLGTTFNKGTRRLHVSHSDKDWDVKEVWSSRAISPYFNDLVLHQDHLYGFDGEFLTCVSLKDGKRCWKERGYGTGQVLLLADQGLLLVLSESGEVALVAADPTKLKELAKFQALEGKTWNHPVVAHGKLFVRNGEEMACYQLAESADK
jgi:outer membrane protein assembly factor BamB